MLPTRKCRPPLVLLLAALFCLATAAAPALAQDNHAPDQARDHGQPPPEHHGDHGRWWDNPHVAKQIGLSDAQKHQMDAIFEKHRPRLKALNATLKSEETALHPLIEADKLDEHKVFQQIDTIAHARANLEKANARMLFGLRKVLTPDQWKKLQAMAREWHAHHHHDWDHGHPDPSEPPPPGPPPQ